MSLLTGSDSSEPRCRRRPLRATITVVSSSPYQLDTVVIGDDPAAWEAAGFAVDGDTTRVANTTLLFVGPGDGRGILRVTVDGVHQEIDGMPFGGRERASSAATSHDNGVVSFDHLVAMTPDMDRTTAEIVRVGLEHRRTRRFEAGGSTKRQSFFWLGDVILELAGEDAAHGDGPALLWGLAFTCSDLDLAAARLGDSLGALKPAVQRGREIATLRTKDLGISVPVVLMSPHPNQEG